MKNEALLTLNRAQFGHESPLVNSEWAEILPGTVTLLLGRNGSGKTTTFRSLLGQIPLLGGEVKLSGKSLKDLRANEISRMVAVAFSRTATPSSLSTFDFVALGRFVHSRYFIRLGQQDLKIIEETLERFNLQIYRRTPVRELSDGNLQKAQIALAAVQQTSLLFLDEPTTHLDTPNKLLIWQILRELASEDQKGLLISTHDWQHALPFADNGWLIHDGVLKTGFAADVIHQNPTQFFGESRGPVKPIRIVAPPAETQLLQSLLAAIPSEKLEILQSFYYVTEGWQVETSAGSLMLKNFAEIWEKLR